MKTTLTFALALVLLLSFCGIGVAADKSGKATLSKIRIIFGQQEVTVEMLDNPASKDLLSLLPLTLEFSDYARAEKIAHLPRRLTTSGSSSPRDAVGDFTYYTPWGNLAVFYKGFGSDSQLIVLGRIVSGKDVLASMAKNFTARIEMVE